MGYVFACKVVKNEGEGSDLQEQSVVVPPILPILMFPRMLSSRRQGKNTEAIFWGLLSTERL